MFFRNITLQVVLIVAGCTHVFSQGNNSDSTKNLPYLDIQIIPVGSVPIARFGRTTNSNANKDGGNQENESKVSPDKQKSGLTVITLPEDERPPRQLYVKRGNSYYTLNCQQNSIGTPYRIHYNTPEIVFYRRVGADSGRGTLKRAFSYTIKPKQKRILITLSKPSTEKKWTDPEVNTYNLSKVGKSKTSAVVINASSSQYLGLKVGKASSILAPQGISLAPVNAAKATSLKFASSLDQKKWSTFQQVTVPTTPATTNIVISFSVPKQESLREFKLIRGKIKQDSYRKPVKYKS